MAQEKIFAKGFNFKRSDSAPEWFVGNISINVDQFIDFLKSNRNGEYVNLKVAQGKQGNYYAELDLWKPTPKSNEEKLTPPTPPSFIPKENESIDKLPF